MIAEQRSLRYPGRVALLVLAAAISNLAPIQLPGDTRFFLGPLFYMPLVLILRRPWGVLAAAVPMATTIYQVGHPFLCAIAALEALWISFGQRFWHRRTLLLDAIFWLVAGIPLLGWFWVGSQGVPGDIFAILATKLALNHIMSVGIAVFLFRQTGLAAWLDGRAIGLRRMRDTVFMSVFVLGVAPLLVAGLGTATLLWAYSAREDEEVLSTTCERIVGQLDLFLSLHESAVASAAGTFQRGLDPTAILEETQRSHPAFITMLATDRTGRLMYAAPAGLPGVRQTDVSDRDYFRLPRERGGVYISGVFKGRGFGRDTLIAISAPYHDEYGQFAGVVEASLEVQEFARRIGDDAQTDGRACIVVVSVTSSGRGDVQIGLIVDTVEEPIHMDDKRVTPPAVFSQTGQFLGAKSVRERVKALLNMDRALSTAAFGGMEAII